MLGVGAQFEGAVRASACASREVLCCSPSEGAAPPSSPSFGVGSLGVKEVRRCARGRAAPVRGGRQRRGGGGEGWWWRRRPLGPTSAAGPVNESERALFSLKDPWCHDQGGGAGAREGWLGRARRVDSRAAAGAGRSLRPRAFSDGRRSVSSPFSDSGSAVCWPACTERRIAMQLHSPRSHSVRSIRHVSCVSVMLSHRSCMHSTTVALHLKSRPSPCVYLRGRPR